MQENTFLMDNKMINANYLDELLCNHISHSNDKIKKNIKKHHMSKIQSIRDYILSILGGNNVDARMLNSCYHRALFDLGLTGYSFYLPSSENSVEVKHNTL